MKSLVNKEHQLIVLYDDQKFDWLEDSYVLGVLQYRYNNKHKSYEIDSVYAQRGWGAETIKLFASWVHPATIINDSSGRITNAMHKLWDKLCEDKFFECYKKGKKLLATSPDSILQKYPKENISRNKQENIFGTADNLLMFEMYKIYSTLIDPYQLTEETQEHVDQLLENEWIVLRDVVWDNYRFSMVYSDRFYILVDGIPSQVFDQKEEAAKNWNWIVYQKKNEKKASSFFDPVTKRGLMEKGPAYFDPSLKRLMK